MLNLAAGNRYLQQILPHLVTKKLESWINQNRTFAIRPALPKKKVQLPEKMLDQTVAIALNQHAVAQNITIQQTHSLILEYASVMQTLLKRMENLELGKFL